MFPWDLDEHKGYNKVEIIGNVLLCYVFIAYLSSLCPGISSERGSIWSEMFLNLPHLFEYEMLVFMLAMMREEPSGVKSARQGCRK